MLQKLSIMLLSNATKITNYAFKKMPQIMLLILASNAPSLQLYYTIKLIFQPRIALSSLIVCCFKVFCFL